MVLRVETTRDPVTTAPPHLGGLPRVKDTITRSRVACLFGGGGEFGGVLCDYSLSGHQLELGGKRDGQERENGSVTAVFGGLKLGVVCLNPSPGGSILEDPSQQ